MGNSADDRKTNQTAARFLTKAGLRYVDEDRASNMIDDAAALAQTEQMPQQSALKIVAGITRRPYGTPRKTI